MNSNLLRPLAFAATLALSAGVAGEEPDKDDPMLCSPDVGKYDAANVRRCTAKLKTPHMSTYNRAITLNIRGNTYEKLKQYDLAIADYTKVIRLLPDFEYAYANRGLVKCKLGDCGAALLDYGAALRVNPKSAYARYGRGVARLRTGDIARGKADIKAASLADPEVEGVYRSLGMEPDKSK